VSHVDEGDVYSIHQLIAYDELAITNDGENIAALELACIESPITFIPSLVDGDEASNWKMLQAACRERTNPDATPLLIFLLHYFDPERLALHRALILVQKWSRDVSLIM